MSLLLKFALSKLIDYLLSPSRKEKKLMNQVPVDEYGVPLVVKGNRHSRRAQESIERRIMRQNK